MPEQSEVYKNHAQDYERLIAKEDYRGNILTAIQSRIDLNNLVIADIGAGTGRFTRMLKPYAKDILGLDLSMQMLRVAKTLLRAHSQSGWYLSAADNRNLPNAANAVDLAIAGWSFGHATVWYEDMWKKEISLSIMELLRIVRPGGTAMVFETLGSGSDEPGPPTKTLADYYTYLEQDLGFEKIIIETDYRFSSLEEAEELSRFFFGDELGDKVVERNWVILPEWTGMWWYIKSS